jgi:hypothetical protein
MAQDANTIVSGFMTPDGKTFKTKAEAVDYLRTPQILAALNKLTDKNAELVAWLIEHEDNIANAFDSGTIRRVTKQERKALEKALAYVVEALGTDPKAKFVVDNADAISDTFKWPNQKRVAPEDKAAAIKTALLELTSEEAADAKVTDWIIANKEGLDAAFNAGVVKREVSQKTLDALAEARAKAAAGREAAKAK